MRAVTFGRPGGPEVLVWGEADLAQPGPHEVVVDVHAAGVNNADLLQRRGSYAVPPGASPILGLEISGVVSSLGSAVTAWSVGDRVCGLLSGGGYAERVVVAADLLLPVPDGVGLISAAALPEAACTVYSNLAMTATLRPGQTLLVHGGGSGIGTFAIQWAKAIGARVVTTAGSDRKLARCIDLGADTALNYVTGDFVAQTLEATGGRGADVVLDIVGGDYLARNLDALAPDGHVVIIANPGGSRPPLDLGLMMGKRASVSATTLRARPHAQKARIVAAVRSEVWPLVDAGRIRPVVDTVYPMDAAASGHELLESGGAVGKVLLGVPGR
jgi:putative PIG3 family NAD(P)H quinone oxidoreductase